MGDLEHRAGRELLAGLGRQLQRPVAAEDREVAAVPALGADPAVADRDRASRLPGDVRVTVRPWARSRAARSAGAADEANTAYCVWLVSPARMASTAVSRSTRTPVRSSIGRLTAVVNPSSDTGALSRPKEVTSWMLLPPSVVAVPEAITAGMPAGVSRESSVGHEPVPSGRSCTVRPPSSDGVSRASPVPSARQRAGSSNPGTVRPAPVTAETVASIAAFGASWPLPAGLAARARSVTRHGAVHSGDTR